MSCKTKFKVLTLEKSTRISLAHKAQVCQCRNVLIVIKLIYRSNLIKFPYSTSLLSSKLTSTPSTLVKQIMTTCNFIWPGLAWSYDDLHELLTSSILLASRCKFSTTRSHKPKWTWVSTSFVYYCVLWHACLHRAALMFFFLCVTCK